MNPSSLKSEKKKRMMNPLTILNNKCLAHKISCFCLRGSVSRIQRQKLQFAQKDDAGHYNT